MSDNDDDDPLGNLGGDDSDRDDPLDDPSRDREDNSEEVIASYNLGDVDDDSDPGRVKRALAWIILQTPLVDQGDSDETDDGPGALTRAWERAGPVLTSGRAKRAYAALGAVVVAILAFWYTLSTTSIVGAILYSFLFLFCAALFPIAINLMGGAMFNGVGKLHLLLGAVAFDHHYLVQRTHGWEWCPGERGGVYIDGEWHDVSGADKYSILGWRPFGILRYKDEDTWADKRADTAGKKARGTFESDPTADGGTAQVTRGGFEEVPRPAITGTEGTWLLDLKRVFTDGVKKIGDIELVETAEEVIERNEVNDGTMSSMGPTIRVLGGIFLGVISMFGYLFLMG